MFVVRSRSDVRQGKGKGKVHPTTDYEGPEGEQRYSSTLSLTLALDGVGGQRHAPAALPTGETRYTLYSHYIDWAITDSDKICTNRFIYK